MDILNRILENKLNREKLISEFQNLVWNSEDSNDILSELAYDLDYYEADELKRKEDPSYYGDDHLENLIREAIKKLEDKMKQ